MWSLLKNAKETTIFRLPHPVNSINITKDGKYVVAAGFTLKIWNISNKTEVFSLDDINHKINSVAISGCERYLIIGYNNSEIRTIEIFQYLNPRKITLTGGHTSRVNSVALSVDGKYIVSGSNDNSIIVWDAKEMKKLVKFVGHADKVHCVAITPDSKFAISGSNDKLLKIWNIEKKTQEMTLKGHNDNVNTLALSRDGKFLVSAGKDSLFYWALTSDSEHFSLCNCFSGITCMAISPNQKKIVYGNKNLSLSILKLKNRKKKSIAQYELKYTIAIAFSPSGKFLVIGCIDRIVSIIDFKTKHLLNSFDGHSGKIKSVVFSPDENFVISSSNDKTLKVWNREKNELAFNINMDSVVNTFSISLDGSCIITGSEDSAVNILRMSSQKQKIISGYAGSISFIYLSPDNKNLFIGCYPKNIIVWNIEKNKGIFSSSNKKKQIISILLTKDKKIVMICYLSKQNIFWNLLQQRKEFFTNGNGKNVSSICFAYNMKYLISNDEINKVSVLKLYKYHQDKELQNSTDALKFGYSSNDNFFVCYLLEDLTVFINLNCEPIRMQYTKWGPSNIFDPYYQSNFLHSDAINF